MHVMTQSLAMHVMTLGQTLCGHQVDRQHQDLCTEHAFMWQIGHEIQACEQSKAETTNHVTHDLRWCTLTVHV